MEATLSWPIRMIDPPRELAEPVEDPPGSGRHTHRVYGVGDAWFATKRDDGQWHAFPDGYAWPLRIAANYDRDNAGRPPLVVMLPGEHLHCVDTAATSGGDGWKVTGTPPRITVNPSIAISYPGHPEMHRFGYHGWIRDGVITDDCEGRRYDAHGRVP
jgi:hypothetical protein